jgi:hypothetical protein
MKMIETKANRHRALLTHLTHQFYGASGLVVRWEREKPCGSPNGIVNNMVKKTDILVREIKCLQFED